MTLTESVSPAVSTVDRMVITEPGVYDIPEDVYHADPVPGGSLSSTGARKLLAPSAPAKFRYALDHPGAEENRVFDFGHVAHKLVLGRGSEIAVIDADNYRTKRAQDEKKAAYAAGATPILAGEMERAEAMAKAVREHPFAGDLFTAGRPEVSVFARDKQTGVMLRARMDWLRDEPMDDGRLLLVDYKTTRDADPDAIAKAVRQHGYHQQDAWYCDVARFAGITDQPAFVFVFQEKEPPYLVTVIELDAAARFWGDVLNRHAINVYAHCMETGRWPGYADDIVPIGLPPWAEREYESRQAAGLYDLKGIFQ